MSLISELLISEFDCTTFVRVVCSSCQYSRESVILAIYLAAALLLLLRACAVDVLQCSHRQTQRQELLQMLYYTFLMLKCKFAANLRCANLQLEILKSGGLSRHDTCHLCTCHFSLKFCGKIGGKGAVPQLGSLLFSPANLQLVYTGCKFSANLQVYKHHKGWASANNCVCVIFV